jgi:hypothetical protein
MSFYSFVIKKSSLINSTCFSLFCHHEKFHGPRLQVIAPQISYNLQNLLVLFIYSLFNYAFSISDCTVSNERMIVNNELERMWKEAVVT